MYVLGVIFGVVVTYIIISTPDTTKVADKIIRQFVTGEINKVYENVEGERIVEALRERGYRCEQL